MTRANKPYTVFREEGRRGVRLERRLNATPEEIWPLLVEPEEAATWLAQLEIQPHVGGTYTLSFDDGMPTSRGHITVFAPPTLLEFGWYEGEAIESRVRIELRADGATTLLVLTHTLLRETEDLRPYAEGWTYHLEILTKQVTAGA